MIPSALAPALLALPLAWRSRAYRGAAAGLVALAGLAVVRELLWAPLDAPTPYSGALRWAWAIDGAALLAGAAGRAAVAWVGLRRRGDERCGYRDRDGVRSNLLWAPDPGARDSNRCFRYGFGQEVQMRSRTGQRSTRRAVAGFAQGCGVVAGSVTVTVALYLAYPILRAAPWLTLSRAALVASAVLQFAAGAWWAAARALRPRAPIAPREWTGLAFAAMAAWDLLGELALPEAMASRWWIAVVGNWIGALLVCAAQVWGLWGTRRTHGSAYR